MKWDDDLELQGALVLLQQNFCSEANFHKYHRNVEVDSSLLQDGRVRESERKTQQLRKGMADPWSKITELHIYIEEVERKGLGRGVGPELPAVSFSYTFLLFL